MSGMIRSIFGKSKRVKEADELLEQHKKETAQEQEVLKFKANAAAQLVKQLERDVSRWH